MATITMPPRWIRSSRWSVTSDPASPTATPSAMNTAENPTMNGAAALSARFGSVALAPIADR
jgi:hypothetical protein